MDVDDFAHKARHAVPFWIVAVLLVLVQVGFGGYPALVKRFAQHAYANAVYFSFVRDAACFPLLIVGARVFEGPLVFPRSIGDLVFFMALGLTGMFGGQLSYILGIYFASPDVASIYQPAMPVWATALVLVTGTEPLPPLNAWRGWFKLSGIGLAAGGAVLMALSKQGKTQMQNPLLGNMCALANTILFAIYLALQKRYLFLPRAKLAFWRDLPVHVTAWSYGFGAFFMILCGLLGFEFNVAFLGFGVGGECAVPADCNVGNNDTSAWRNFCDGTTCRMKTDSLTIPSESVGPLVYAVFVTSAINYGLISFANRHASTSTITAFWPLQVLVAVVISYLVFGDTITYMQIGGAVMIAAGLGLVVVSNWLEERLHHAYALLVNE
eukprot:m.29793 g.29793  ORF g.29793 m.29793 type:complete len:382 (+) comp9275_c0_seq1:145-1290(+)